ncbi:MAG: tetratricopeptide repeat protein [Campylobacterota bacterium]|nr:tetratricopeptide repeat protein [Campylobacterota bacterium]
MKGIILGLMMIWSVSLNADLVGEGLSAYQNGNYKSAIVLWDKACSEGKTDGCYNLAYVYATGKGVLHDEKKAAGLYSRGCDGGDLQACSNLGALYENGVGGIQRDFYKSSRLYAKSCNGGNVDGCFNLGVTYYRGRGVYRDFQIASELYADSCNKGHIEGCYNLANMYRYGKGGVIREDKPKAKRLYLKACKMGSSGACSKFRRLRDEGIK